MAQRHSDHETVQCALCNKLGHILDCCRNSTKSCLTCDELTQIAAQDTKKHQADLAALQSRIAQLEHENPNSKHDQLRDEKNAQLIALKADVEVVKEEEKQLHKDIKIGEERLKKLEAELRELQPKKKEERAPEFFVKTAKPKKGKKKDA